MTIDTRPPPYNPHYNSSVPAPPTYHQNIYPQQPSSQVYQPHFIQPSEPRPHNLVVIPHKRKQKRQRNPLVHFFCCLTAALSGCLTAPFWCCYCIAEDME